MCVLLVAKLCLTLLQPHGLQLARLLRLLCPWAFPGKILEWVAISFSRDLPDPGIEPASPAWQTDSLPLSHLGKPINPWAIFLIINAVNLEGKTCYRDGGDILVVSELETLELIEIVWSTILSTSDGVCSLATRGANCTACNVDV